MTADIPLKKNTKSHQLCNSWRSVLRVSGYSTVARPRLYMKRENPLGLSSKMHLKGPPLPEKV
jgi:hypothetical protein